MNNPFVQIIKGKTILVGVGNILRGDDGLGPELIGKLKDIENKNIVCINTGSSPESFTGKIIKEKPDTILIVDALHLGKAAGTYQLLKADEIAKVGFTTHDISPGMFIDYIKSQIKANIYFLAVQPQDVSFGEGLSLPVKNTLAKIKNWLKEASYA